ncbi:MAG TPA: hypothetical protein VL179_00825, partial [Mycobacterium sp.]|nr:hypothetical protein [Mycobacterium sp.]
MTAPPVARIGLSRTIFGPPRTRAEAAICMVGTALVIALLAGYIQHTGGWADRSIVQIAVLALIIFDLIFGMFTISTTTAKRWYHRPGPDALRFRAIFVLSHLLYLIAAAALLDTGWAWAMVNAGLLLGAACAVEIAPVDLKRIVALGLILTAGLINLIWLPLPVTLAWLPLLLFVKILACFLLPER